MKRTLAAILLLLATPASAQMMATGIGGGGFGGGAAPYVGPADINGAASVYYGFRCIDTAYTGNVASIWDSATGSTTNTILTCSAGGTINETVNSIATTCASGCVVATLYDQSGANLCGGSPCDATQATNANRPAFSNALSGITAGRFGMTCGGGSVTLSSATMSSSVSQPLTILWTARKTSGSSQYRALQNNGLEVGYDGTNLTFFYSGGSYPNSAAATDNVWHAVQTTLSVALSASATYVDGSNTAHAAATGPVGLSSGSANVICASGFNGNITEIGVWSGNQSANNAALNTNVHSYWGF
jgi:hypothetical protein